MARWDPDAKGKLAEAAMALFVERGYATTTVTDIAAAAGVTERTFFRHYSDKREVLFTGSAAVLEAIVGSLTNNGSDDDAFDLVVAAYVDVATVLEARVERSHSRARRRLLLDNPELHERELIKLATMTSTMVASLLARGIANDDAVLAAEAGMVAFKIGFDRWLDDVDERHSFAAHLRATVVDLTQLTTRARR
ncbi:MAG TPA: helix-turn-helix domain-containing protein [Myxococcota bacterium]